MNRLWMLAIVTGFLFSANDAQAQFGPDGSITGLEGRHRIEKLNFAKSKYRPVGLAGSYDRRGGYFFGTRVGYSVHHGLTPTPAYRSSLVNPGPFARSRYYGLGW